MTPSNKYQDYCEEDFTKDPLFRSWVLAPDEVNKSFWDHWLLQHPDKQPVLENARWQMLQLTVEGETIAQERLDAIWNTIQISKATVEAEKAVDPQVPASGAGKVIPLFPWKVLQQMAAVFLLLGFSTGLMYYFLRPAPISGHQVATTYGEIKTVTLPDQSQVVLNGNSTLSYNGTWRNEQDREVSLQGEAYFKVRHAKNHRKFRVKLKDGVCITVLGTTFTITQRPTRTQVVLNEGQVKVSKEQEKYYGLQTRVLGEALMQPGDLVEVQQKGALFRKTTVEQPQVYAAFTQKKIVFKNSLLSEVARVLEDTYGYQISLLKPGLASKRFSGTTPTDDIDMLFSAIEKVFQVQVIKNEKHIIIK